MMCYWNYINSQLYMKLVTQNLIQISLFLLCLLFAGCSNSQVNMVEKDKEPTTLSLNNDMCSFIEPVVAEKHHRFALIVGVGEYKKDSIRDLAGPPNDAQQFYDLLTGPDGYGFPKENVCLLLDENATTAQFKNAFERGLIGRASEKDVAVIFYAGHGSQKRDKNNDEPDEWDETFLFHDSRTGKVGEFLDDEFYQLLKRLHSKTKNITVILDSCNSGTATRAEKGTLVERYSMPVEEPENASVGVELEGDGGGAWLPEEMPGLVVLSAAADGTSAVEKGGQGVFTGAILHVFSQAYNHPLTYAQASRQIPHLMSAKSYQTPYFQGDLSKTVFGNKERTRPRSWEVISLGPPIKLGGPPIPGIGIGAELRIYSGNLTGADTRDPSKAKATVVIDRMTGLNGLAKVVAATADAPDVFKGDLAVLVRTGNDFLKLKLRLRPANEAGGISTERSTAIRVAIEGSTQTKNLVEVTDGAGDFELSISSDNHIVLKGPENKVRNAYESNEEMIDNLRQHARQRALLQLQGEGGADFSDNQTLLVKIVPAVKQSQCATGFWEQAEYNSAQIIPLCQSWHVKISLAENAPMELLVGGVILSSDGNIYGFPRHGRKIPIKPGKSVTLSEKFIGAPPLDVQDHLIVFGTQKTNPVDWHLLTDIITRGPNLPKKGLFRALDSYLRAESRGQILEEDEVENTTWTISSLTMRVEANQRFQKPPKNNDFLINNREYTIANFDIRPYLPDDPETSLHKVLQQADQLAQSSAKDGYGYEQHSWSEYTDKENLALGIDCSRAIWYAFTRGELPYNNQNSYLTTKMMVEEESAMDDDFERCDNDPNLQLGDILVYRDDTREDGHVIMVIDPQKRIGWGAHGWDGNSQKLKTEPDTGVEYQLIKNKFDWQRWDRSSMKRKACWRYRSFITEAKTSRGRPGSRALMDACDAKSCNK